MNVKYKKHGTDEIQAYITVGIETFCGFGYTNELAKADILHRNYKECHERLTILDELTAEGEL